MTQSVSQWSYTSFIWIKKRTWTKKWWTLLCRVSRIRSTFMSISFSFCINTSMFSRLTSWTDSSTYIIKSSTKRKLSAKPWSVSTTLLRYPYSYTGYAGRLSKSRFTLWLRSANFCRTFYWNLCTSIFHFKTIFWLCINSWRSRFWTWQKAKIV